MKAALVHQDLRSRDYRDWREFLREAERWSRADIEAYQLTKLREVLRHAYETTPGYRELWERAGYDPQASVSFETVRQLPFVEKETIRDRLEAFTSFKARCKYVTTGGSTGIPFGFYRDGVAFARELASKAHQYARVGWKEGDPQLVFRGTVINAHNRIQFYPRFNELRCSSYFLTPEKMENYRATAIRYRPQWLRCYPSSGFLFARFLEESGREFPPLKGILCASENLYENQRETLRRVFGCRVFSHYGHFELSALAGFCEHADTYHVLPQYGYVELLDPEGRPVTTPGQVGEIVATSFLMRATPFVRYRTRDYAVFQSHGCSYCGRPYEVWERIEGRLQEFVLTGRGRLISMTAINMHDDIFDHLEQFQFVQEQRGVATFNYVPKPTCTSSIVADICRRLGLKFGDDMRLVMQPVQRIEPTKRGKHRFLIQKLTLQGHDN